MDVSQKELLQKAKKNEHAYERLIELCDDIGHRISGSPQLDLSSAEELASIQAGKFQFSVVFG